jgi:hypothetical protein
MRWLMLKKDVSQFSLIPPTTDPLRASDARQITRALVDASPLRPAELDWNPLTTIFVPTPQLSLLIARFAAVKLWMSNV